MKRITDVLSRKAFACVALLTLCFIAAAHPGSVGEKAVSADAFVNSLGVNVHLHFADTSYGNFAAVEKALKDLGVRHIRDGLVDTQWTPYYDRLNELGRSGIKAILITSPKESAAVLAAYPQHVADSFEAYEGPNEYDLSGDKDWSGTLNAFVSVLYQAVNDGSSVAAGASRTSRSAPPATGNPPKTPSASATATPPKAPAGLQVATSGSRTAKYPVVAPSLTQPASFPKVAGTGQFADFANLHNYFGGRNPGTPGWGANGYGSYPWNLNLAASAWPGKPVYTTETGYFNDVATLTGVPEVVSGKYMPRLFFEQWMHGIQRTYVYELVDLHAGGAGSNSYGLLHSDFSPKPAFTAVRGLIGLLADPGPSFVPGNLDFTLSGDLTDVHHLLLQRRNGTFFLAIWIEQLGYDVNARKELAVADRSLVVKTTTSLKMKAHRLGLDGSIQSSDLGAGLAHTVSIGDRVVILEISQ